MTQEIAIKKLEILTSELKKELSNLFDEFNIKIEVRNSRVVFTDSIKGDVFEYSNGNYEIFRYGMNGMCSTSSEKTFTSFERTLKLATVIKDNLNMLLEKSFEYSKKANEICNQIK